MGLALNLKILFCILGVAMVGTFTYTVCVDGLPFRSDIFGPWFIDTLIDCTIINAILIGAWVSYKESSWITALFWIMLLICFQSVTVCVYIVFRLSKLSAEESSLDPIYNTLIRHSSKKEVKDERCIPISAARFIFVTIGCPVLGLSIYALLKDGFPKSDTFTPWMMVLLVNFLVSETAISVWLFYKESNWISPLIWIVLILFVFGSTAICAYIILQMYYLSPQDPVHLVLFNSASKKKLETEGAKKQLAGDIESADL